MLSQIIKYEIRRALKTPSTYVYFFLMSAFSFFLVCAAGGAFDSFSFYLSGSEKVFVNSPYIINLLVSILSYVGIIIIAALVGQSGYRDYKHQTFPLFYTTSVKPSALFFGRFTGALATTALVFLSLLIGFYAATLMPWIKEGRFTENMFMAYLQPFWTIIVPNLLFIGAIFYGLIILTRNIFTNWLIILLFYILYGVSMKITADLDNEFIAALIDPFGMQASSYVTQYWSVAERNSRIIPLTGALLYNRLLWTGFGIGILMLCNFKFKFSQYPQLNFLSGKRRKNKHASALKIAHLLTFAGIHLPEVNLNFSWKSRLKQLFSLAFMELKSTVKNKYFIIIFLFGLLFIFLSSGQIGKYYDTVTYPVTYMVTEFIGATFHIFVIIITTFFAGEMIWKSRKHQMDEIIDSLPVPNWLQLGPKVLAMLGLQFLLMVVVIVSGILIQTFKGYYNYEIGLYIKEMIGIRLIDLWLFTALVFFIHVLVNHKYLGHFLVITYLIADTYIGSTFLQHNLLQFASDPGVAYSDMNKYGHSIFPFVMFKIYWGSLALLFVVTANAFWTRGKELQFKKRWKYFRKQLNRPAYITGAVCLIVFLLSGGFIFYNTNIINEYSTRHDSELKAVDYEKKYGHFKGVPQPKITSVKANVNIYPEHRDINASAVFLLKNKTSVSIDSLHLSFPDVIVNELDISRDHENVLHDETHRYRIYKLNTALQPGETLKISADISKNQNGFTNNYRSSLIGSIYNGTFVNNRVIFPQIGYNEGKELSGNSRREEHGLPYKRPSSPISDEKAHQNNMLTDDADFIDFEAIVSTSKNQVAMTPGYLQKEWTRNGRRYFHYKMDSKIINFYPFLSADYTIKKDDWINKSGDSISIEIYHHKNHEYNLEKMMASVKNSLEYYTRHFSPYQHRQVRILEFPRYQSFAQSFSNTIPFSEAIGFIADTREAGTSDKSSLKIDYPYWVTAHEMAHQWFAHQVVGADVEGSNMLSETLAQYASTMVLEQVYGKEHIKKFLKHELDNYLRNRANESEKELPLAYAHQSYILYKKGAVTMYALKEYIGEDALNTALRKYIKEVAFQEPPYTDSHEFLDHIRKATPDSLEYIIDDWFTGIVLYSNKITEARAKKTKEGQYRLEADLEINKYEVDSLGKKKAVELNDYIAIGVYNRNNELIHHKKHLFRERDTKLILELDEKPSEIVIDPYYLLTDKNHRNKAKTVEIAKE